MLHRHPEIRELHLVDPYIEYHQERDRARAGRIAHKRMAKFGSRVQFHRCSVESANLPMLDFAYIAEVKFNRQVAKSAKAIQIRKAGLYLFTPK